MSAEVIGFIASNIVTVGSLLWIFNKMYIRTQLNALEMRLGQSIDALRSDNKLVAQQREQDRKSLDTLKSKVENDSGRNQRLHEGTVERINKIEVELAPIKTNVEILMNHVLDNRGAR